MTSGELAALLGVSAETVRVWSKEVGAFLSPEAAPGAGGARYFNPEDRRILALVATMRKRHQPLDAIHQALAAGERGEVPRGEEVYGTVEDQPGTSLTVSQMTALLGEARGEVGVLRQERDRLLGEVQTERAARVAALERAARAEGRLSVLEEQRAPQGPTSPATEGTAGEGSAPTGPKKEGAGATAEGVGAVPTQKKEGEGGKAGADRGRRSWWERWRGR